MSAPAGPGADPHHRTARLLLALLLALACYLQFTSVSRTIVSAPLRQDAGDYFSYAWNLDRHGSYSSARTWLDPAVPATADATRTPGYPLFLLAFGHPQPERAWIARIALAQAVLCVLSVWLTWAIGRRALGRWGALLAGLLVATNPYFQVASSYLLTESLFAFAMLLSLLATVRAAERPGARVPALLAGLAWGACSLVRPTTQFLPLLLLLLAFAWPALSRWRRASAWCLLGFALAWAPWALRNQVAGVGESGSRLAVNSIAHGAYPDFMYERRIDSFGMPYLDDPAYPAMARDLPTLLGEIGARARREPARYAGWYLFGKPYYFLSMRDVQARDIQIYELERTPWYEQAPFRALHSAWRKLHWPLTLLALASLAWLFVAPRRLPLAPAARQAAVLVALVLAYAIAVHVVAAPFPRYGIPFRPLVAMLALLPLFAAWRRGRDEAVDG